MIIDSDHKITPVAVDLTMTPLQFGIVLKVLQPLSSAVTQQVPISLVDNVDNEVFFPVFACNFGFGWFLQDTKVCSFQDA